MTIQDGLTTPDAAADLARQVLREIKRPFRLCGDLAYVDVSIGIAFSSSATDPRTELMRKADIALYEAKRAGRGCYRVFDEDLDRIVRQKRVIERDLRDALAGGDGLSLCYQPLYDMAYSRLVGAEALMRWTRDGPALSPEMLVSVAEERGLMPQLGLWVLREACATAVALELPSIAVNVSASQFREPGLVDSIFATLSETGLAPARLQIEITEDLLLDESLSVSDALSALHRQGIQIVLDDFGSGYSSLSYLTRYKVDKIKIDRSFVSQLGPDPDSQAIVKTILDLSVSLGLDVVAEGVESEEQWRILRSLGTPDLQGYNFSRPLPATALRQRLSGECRTSRHRGDIALSGSRTIYV